MPVIYRSIIRPPGRPCVYDKLANALASYQPMRSLNRVVSLKILDISTECNRVNRENLRYLFFCLFSPPVDCVYSNSFVFLYVFLASFPSWTLSLRVIAFLVAGRRGKILLLPFTLAPSARSNILPWYNYGRRWAEFGQRNVISWRLKFNFERVP